MAETKKSKLNFRYQGPYKIIRKISCVVYLVEIVNER